VTHLAQNDIGGILDSFADVIEGGNSYRGSGSAFRGLPGAHSNDNGLAKDGDDSAVASGAGSTTTIVYASGAGASERWVKSNIPGFFAICNTQASGVRNKGAARRITGWNLGTKTWTVDAFPEATAQNDTFEIVQGFKRLPDGEDIEAEEIDSGWDRFFSFEIDDAGVDAGLWGAGVATYTTELNLRLRILKHGRGQRAAQSAITNMSILRDGLTKPLNRSGLVRALLPIGGTSSEKDTHKIVITQTYQLHYRIETTYK